MVGQIVCERLQQSAGRRAVLRDRDAFPVFVDTVRGIEPLVASTLARIAREVDSQTVDRLASVVRRIFSRVLRELADIDNPMRSNLGVDPGDGALLAETTPEQPVPAIRAGSALVEEGTTIVSSRYSTRPQLAGGLRAFRVTPLHTPMVAVLTFPRSLPTPRLEKREAVSIPRQASSSTTTATRTTSLSRTTRRCSSTTWPSS